MSNKRYFKILGATKDDATGIVNLLHKKTFYPEVTSVPPLPGTFSVGFDYRQFFVVIGLASDGGIIVYTRSEYTDVEFGTNVIPTNDWTTRYKLYIAPSIIALPNYTEIRNNVNTNNSGINYFLSYDYNLTNNF